MLMCCICSGHRAVVGRGDRCDREDEMGGGPRTPTSLHAYARARAAAGVCAAYSSPALLRSTSPDCGGASPTLVRLRVSPTARPTPTVRLPDRLRQSDCQTDSDSPTARPETAASAPARALTCRVLYDRSLEYAEGLHNHAKYFLLTAQASIYSGAPHSALFTSGQPRLQSSIPVNALTWIPICYPPHPQKRVKLPWKLLISSSLDMRDPMRTHTLRLPAGRGQLTLHP